MEALAKGAMRFSHRFTVRELRERWRALLYDPELSAEASARMVEAEAAISDLPPKAGGTQVRNAIHLEQKRRLNSIRFLYHKRKRSLAEGKPISATESQTLDDGAIREAVEKHEEGREKAGVAPLSSMPLGNVDPGLLEGLLSPKGGAASDFDSDGTFTQMVSLLAAGQSVYASYHFEYDHQNMIDTAIQWNVYLICVLSVFEGKRFNALHSIRVLSVFWRKVCLTVKNGLQVELELFLVLCQETQIQKLRKIKREDKKVGMMNS